MNATATLTMAELSDSWDNLWELDHPINLEELIESDLLATHRNFKEYISVIFQVSGSISFISSVLIIYHILHSYQCLSNTYNRLIFVLSVADIFSSLPHALSTRMAPEELNYFVPYAQGTVVTCDIQGFFLTLGSMMNHTYSSALCLYYLAIIRYNKKEAYIKAKLEPWFHLLSIVFSIVVSSVILSSKKYNYSPEGGTCMAPLSGSYSPPHCIGYEDGTIVDGFTIPCGRGDLKDKPLPRTVISVAYMMILILPFVLAWTIFLMYRSVLEIEKKMKSYGVGSLRLRASIVVRAPLEIVDGSNEDTRASVIVRAPLENVDGSNEDTSMRNSNINTSANASEENRGFLGKIMDIIKRIIPCLDQKNTNENFCKHLKTKSQARKRTILNMATRYFLAWFFVVVPFIFAMTVPGKLTNILVAIFTPLRGLFNLFVYLSQKASFYKFTKTEHLTWCQAITKAWFSRGEKSREIKSRPNLSFLKLSIQKAKSFSIGRACSCLGCWKFNRFSNNSTARSTTHTSVKSINSASRKSACSLPTSTPRALNSLDDVTDMERNMKFLHTRKCERKVFFLEHLDDGRLEEGKFEEPEGANEKVAINLPPAVQTIEAKKDIEEFGV